MNDILVVKVKKPNPVEVWIGNDEYLVYWSGEMDTYIDAVFDSVKKAFEDYDHFKINTFDNLHKTILEIVDPNSGKAK